MNDLKKVDWVDDRRFERDGLCVVVQKLPLRWPRYSLFVGTAREDHVLRFMPIKATGKGKISVDRVSSVIAELLMQAEDYIQGELQYIEDMRIDEHQFYEARELNKDKAKRGLSGGPGSGKTARKRAAKQQRRHQESA